MIRTSRRKTLGLMAAMAVVTMMLAMTTPASASRGYITEFWYYSDASHTVDVGYGYIDCNWQFHLIAGTTSDFYDTQDTQCSADPGGESSQVACASPGSTDGAAGPAMAATPTLGE